MNNEHNPIAVRIDKIGALWEHTRRNNPDVRLFCMSCQTDDMPLVEGFLRLECSAYGKSEDTFVVFKTDFDNKTDFFIFLISEWLRSFEQELKEHKVSRWTEFYDFCREYETIDKSSNEALKEFYIRLITSFKAFEGRNNNILSIVFIIKKISDCRELKDAIKELASLLPHNIGFLLIDYKGRNAYKPLLEELPPITILIDIPDQDMGGAYKELATQGNPNDLHVRYRKCLFRLGEAAQQNNTPKVIEQGEELISICRASGQASFWASAYLVYAGFLFGFKQEHERVNRLLDTGISIVTPEYREKSDSLGVLLQLYMYKGAFMNMIGEKEQAVDFFLKSAELARENNQPLQTLTGYNYALIVAMKKEKNYYMPILIRAFEYGYSLSDEDLKTANLAFIAYNYINRYPQVDAQEKENIVRRMASLYGENWHRTPQETAKQMQAEYEPVKM